LPDSFCCSFSLQFYQNTFYTLAYHSSKTKENKLFRMKKGDSQWEGIEGPAPHLRIGHAPVFTNTGLYIFTEDLETQKGGFFKLGLKDKDMNR